MPFCSNRTFMELKLKSSQASLEKSARSNRTFMELKYSKKWMEKFGIKF